MSKDNYINIFDVGASKIRFTVFDKKLNNIFSNNISISHDKEYIDYLDQIKQIVKNAEKKISTHIENIVLATDTNELISINLSLKKIFDNEIKLFKVYKIILKELRQLINSNYPNYEIVHIIFQKGIIDKKIYYDLPENKNLKEISVDFKIVCYPKLILKNLNINFSKCNLEITNIFCSSYLKSISYFAKFDKKDISFLDIGLNKTNLIIYKDKKIVSISSIPIGGLSITKDIAKIFEINITDAEKIKKLFNKSGTEFSYSGNIEETDITVNQILKKRISIDLLKKVILHRVQEIIDLSFNSSFNGAFKKKINNINLYLIGEGSKLLNNNLFHLNDKYGLSSINYYHETDVEICKSVLFYYLNSSEISLNVDKKKGLFEVFFNFFSK